MVLSVVSLFAALAQSPGAVVAPNPEELWREYDAEKGDFKEEILQQETKDGILRRKFYISAYVLGEEIRVYCDYRVPSGARNAPALLNVHGWMGAPAVDESYVKEGWAVLAHDYCGKTGDRPHFTRYPERLRHGNMDAKTAERVISTLPDGTEITDPRQSSDYLWYAVQRRALSYLAAQPEVDRKRMGAVGYSYGGTLMWNLAMDPRIKAVAAYFGIGYNVYYRDRHVWMYPPDASAPPPKPGEEVFLKSLAPEAHVPFLKAATLFLNGSNDHHGGHERGLESFKRFPAGVPWAFAVQARGHHNTEKVGQNTRIWLQKHVLGHDHFWPAHPESSLRLDPQGIPELVVTPASPEKVTSVEFYYAQKNPVSYARYWRDIPGVRKEGQWTAQLPVLNVQDYVFGYANILYENSVVRSTNFNAAVPAQLGNARATDQASEHIGAGEGWSEVAEAEGVGGVTGFRCLNKQRGSTTDKLHDPKWKAPQGTALVFRFYCTEPQSLSLLADLRFSADLEMTASDQWQEMTVPASNLLNVFSQKPMSEWSEVGSLQLKPKPGTDITRVIFADFRWKKLP